MDSRSPWREAGVFDLERGEYHVKKIPRPPEARVYFKHDDYLRRESIAGHELKVSCPKCFDQIIVRWQRAYSDSAVEDAADYHHPELMAMNVARHMSDVAAKAEREKAAAVSRAREALELADKATAAFMRIQVKRSRQERKKQTKQRAKGRVK